MNPDDRDRDGAQRISDFADAVVVGKRVREEGQRIYGPQDQEFPELASLARELTGIRVIPPPDFAETLEQRLPAADALAEMPRGRIVSHVSSAIRQSAKRAAAFARSFWSRVVRRSSLRH